MNVGSTSVNQLTCFAGRSLSWMLGHMPHIGKSGLRAPTNEFLPAPQNGTDPVFDFRVERCLTAFC